MAKTDQIRDEKKLNRLVRVQLELAIEDLKRQGVNPLIVETLRTRERQKFLFAQGRSEEQCRAMGIPEEYARTGKIVTSTLNSIHITGCAVDVVPLRVGKAIWNRHDKDTHKIIVTMAKYGFECGANWTRFSDSPHYQVKGVSSAATVYSKSNNNYYITKAIQKALNEKLGLNLKVDGKWGSRTTNAVNAFRNKLGFKASGTVGVTVLRKLLG